MQRDRSYDNDMRRDRLHSSPRAARLILIAGAAVHFAACIPLYGRRGFPEVDPFWLAMIWLWLPPVFISAVYSRWSRRRAVDLALYALAVGFVVSWGTVTVIPNRKTPLEAFSELVLYWPMLTVCVAIVEALSQRFLAWVRVFAREPAGVYCESCGYCLYGLTEPRCPECGSPFAAEYLQPESEPVVLPVSRRWTTLLVALALVATVAFPFIYRAWSFRSVAAAGRRQAEDDWTRGQVTWFVTREERQAMTPQQEERFMDLRFRHDPSTGMKIEAMLHRDWRHLVWESAYRSVIDRKLRESGRRPPEF